MNVFEAQHYGLCKLCGDAIEQGDPITCTSVGWVHAVCPDDAEPEPIEGGVCPRCFLVRSLSGDCGCYS